MLCASSLDEFQKQATIQDPHFHSILLEIPKVKEPSTEKDHDSLNWNGEDEMNFNRNISMLSSDPTSQEKSVVQSNIASREPAHPGQVSNKQPVSSSSKDEKNLCRATDNSKSTNLAFTKRGHRRLPCKARGVPEDHNAITAFFDIAEDTEHGAILICSHPECAGSGRRFRYCATCSIPVAKRNFLKRHSHDGRPIKPLPSSKGKKKVSSDDEMAANVDTEKKAQSDSSMGSEEDDDIGDSVEDALDRYLDSEESTNGEGHQTHQPSATISPGPFLQMPAQSSTVNFHAPKLHESLHTLDEAHPHSSKQHSVQPTPNFISTLNKAPPVYGGPQVSMHLTPREIQWVKLLHSRPSTDNTTLMHHWMESVLLLSEAKHSDNAIAHQSSNPSVNLLHVNHGANSNTGKRPSIGHTSDKEDFKRIRLGSLGDMSFMQDVADIFD